jgi:CheY-like chemotaxis protein
MMPKMDGFQVLEKLKNDQDLKNIPVILLTNFGEDEGVKKGLSLGAVDYIVKVQTDPVDVIKKVKGALRQS